MRTAQLPLEEEKRLSALSDYHILDTPAEQVFDDITSLATTICEVPAAYISFIDADRQWFKSVQGLQQNQPVSRDIALCAHAILQKETTEVADTLEDARFHDNPLVTAAPNIRFYVAVPLISDAGYALGTLSVIDHQPNRLSPLQRASIQKLAEVVMSLLEAHKVHVKTRSALGQSEKRFRDFAEASTDWLWETDTEHRYTWFSRNVEAVTGVPREWHYGKTRLEITEDDIDSPQWQNHLQLLTSKQPFRDFELCRRGPDGLRWIRSNGVPVFDECGIFQGYRGTGTDISARKKMQQTLHEREQLLRLITDSLPVLIASYDADQRYQFVNKTFERWYQRPRESVLGVHLKEVVGKRAYQVLAPYLETALAGQDISVELERPEPDGEMRCVRAFYVPQSDQNGKTIGIHALIIDVGEQQTINPAWSIDKKWSRIPRSTIADVLTHDISRLPLPHSRFKHFGKREMIGDSAEMQQMYQLIGQIGNGDWTVLIEGETGVGKELVARAIHAVSARHNGPFIAVNSAGLSESLLASQLFGHRRGAFTGAVSDQKGLFEAADGGTIFLDEIGDLPLVMQASLLRVLQEKEINRLGDTRPRKINVRIIAATHKNLSSEIRSGRFREDLLYRLRVARIHVPPLRERRDDIVLLFRFFLNEGCLNTGRTVNRISPQAIQLLHHYHWPGNVRELKAAADHAIIYCSGQTVQNEHLPPELRQFNTSIETTKPGDISLSDLQSALARTRGNRTQAARLLGISRATFYRRLQELE